MRRRLTVIGHSSNTSRRRMASILRTQKLHQFWKDGGVGTFLVEEALKDIEAQEQKLAPLCPFVAAYLKQYPEWKHLLANGYNV